MTTSKPMARAFAVALTACGCVAGAGCWWIPGDGPRHSIFDVHPHDCERNDRGDCVVCKSDKDCQARFGVDYGCDREANTCASCFDGAKNGRETGVDCGGPKCAPCTGRHACRDNEVYAPREAVCCSTSCSQKCMACTRSRTGEPDGTCATVPAGADPFRECESLGGCTPSGKCRCEDGIKNGDETDVDCGGKTCPRCWGGKTCAAAADCARDVPVCVNGACCESQCDDRCRACDARGACMNAPAGREDPRCPQDTACGHDGGCVGRAGARCTANEQCLSRVCAGGRCAKSALLRSCTSAVDCASGTCDGHVCQ